MRRAELGGVDGLEIVSATHVRDRIAPNVPHKVDSLSALSLDAAPDSSRSRAAHRLARPVDWPAVRSSVQEIA
jgi:hypothetical protein